VRDTIGLQRMESRVLEPGARLKLKLHRLKSAMVSALRPKSETTSKGGVDIRRVLEGAPFLEQRVKVNFEHL
jgi:hypothetical protein